LSDFNRGCRAESPWGFSWDHHVWWVGGDGSGGLYFINCRDNASCHIYYLDHGDPAEDFDEQARLKPRLLSECVRDLEQSEAEFEHDRIRLLQRIADRQWWQFWIPSSPPVWALDPGDKNRNERIP
jgi:hypothetical protein